MKKRTFIFLIMFIAFTMVVSDLFAEAGEGGKTSRKKIGVIVTLLPLADFLEHIGKERVEVDVLVPPGANPHIYEPTPGQLRKVSKAKIFVKVGSGVEFELRWIDKLIAVNKNMLVVDTSFRVEMIEKDPHIWLSPLNVQIQTENIYQGLVKIDPENKGYYEGNKNEFLDQLKKLDKTIKNNLAGAEGKKFIVFHPAWGYFARDYGLIQIPVEIEGKKPSARDIKRLIDRAKRDNIKVIFASPQFNAESARVIAKEIDGQVVFINPLSKNYLINMRNISIYFSYRQK